MTLSTPRKLIPPGVSFFVLTWLSLTAGQKQTAVFDLRKLRAGQKAGNQRSAQVKNPYFQVKTAVCTIISAVYTKSLKLPFFHFFCYIFAATFEARSRVPIMKGWFKQ
ncbi:MAG: hypothetical protein IJP46_03550 [Prevotella sp.]|nr:hypothetical protein [Prevotella sp.]